MHTEIKLCHVALAGAFLSINFLMGCQTYKPDPVNLDRHMESWQHRSLKNEDINAFASNLPAESICDYSQITFNLSDGLSMQEAELVGLVYNPGLRVSRAAVLSGQAQAEYAGLWNDPTLNFNLLRILESIPQPWLLANSVSFNIPISGRLQAQKKKAESALNASRAWISQSEWEVIRDIRATWVDWTAHQLKFDQLQSVVRDLQILSESAGLMAARGELSPTQARLLEIEYATQLGELEKFRAAVEVSEKSIRILLGLSPSAAISFQSGFPGFMERDSSEDSARLVNQNLSLAALAQDYRFSESALVLEIRKQYPDLTLGPQFESEEGVTRIGLSGNIPIPVLNANKGNIASARAQRDTARIALETEMEKLQGALAVHHATLRGAESRLRNFNSNIMPLVDRQLDEARQLSRIGEGGVLTILESLVRVNQAKLNLVDIQADRAISNIQIEFLVGPNSESYSNPSSDID